MFKAIKPLKKIWYVKDNIPGTVHISRTGQPVDFRPATIMTYWRQTEASINTVISRPKGQTPFQDHIKGRVIEARYDFPNDTIVVGEFFLPNSATRFTDETTVARQTVIPGFPPPAEHTEQVYAWLKGIEVEAARRRAERDAEPADAHITAFQRWLHDAVCDPQKKRVIARFARTGRNKEQMQALVQQAPALAKYKANLKYESLRDLVLAA